MEVQASEVNWLMMLLGTYFLLVGALEVFSPRLASRLVERIFKFEPTQLLALWPLTIALLGFLGSPVKNLQWFVVFIIWLYGVMGLWILIDPASFRGLLGRAWAETEEPRRGRMLQVDGFTHWAAAYLIWTAAKG